MIGVLAFQGGFAEHQKVLDSLGIANKQVRGVDDLSGLTGLIIPGGESTVMSKFLAETGVGNLVKKLAKDPTFKIYGTCAGLILLARLRLLDVVVERNAYGRQIASFIADLEVLSLGKTRAHFIRAPKIVSVGEGVEVLASHEGVPVFVRSGNIYASSFHPELAGCLDIHKLIFA